MTKEHPQAALLRLAADDESAMFTCDEDFNRPRTIHYVITNKQYNWKLYTPRKPDVVDYGLDYTYATYWHNSLIAARKDFDYRVIRMVKRTINGETGNITIEALT